MTVALSTLFPQFGTQAWPAVTHTASTPLLQGGFVSCLLSSRLRAGAAALERESGWGLTPGHRFSYSLRQVFPCVLPHTAALCP